MSHRYIAMLWLVTSVLTVTACTEDQMVINARTSANETVPPGSGNQSGENTNPADGNASSGIDTQPPAVKALQDNELVVHLTLDNDKRKSP